MQPNDYLRKNYNLTAIKSEPLSTGFGIFGHKVWLDDGRIGAIKSNFSSSSSVFLLEAKMLNALANQKWPTPCVWEADEHCLLMEWLESDQLAYGAGEEFGVGQTLAQLHQGSAPAHDPYFGYDYNTPIGALTQPNPKTASWIDFFKQHRLMHLGQLAMQKHLLPLDVYERFCRFCADLHHFIDEPCQPSLIHGDIWGGNVITNKGRLLGFIDPAIYYAHFEIELAFTQMFGTFGPDFFKGYQSVQPLDQDFFMNRIDIYNLYPTLVHLALFGVSYLAPIERTLKKFGY